MLNVSRLRKLAGALLALACLSAAPAAFSSAIPDTVNRVKDKDAPDAARCVPIPAPECVTKRDRALARSCISKAEFDTLVTNQDVPMCDVEEEDPMKRLVGWCPCGCFEASTQILTVPQDGAAVYKTAKQLYADRKTSQVASLDAASSLTEPQLVARDIFRSTKGPEEEDLYVFRTLDGRVLKLTRNHGVLRGDGVMVAAFELEEGDSLVATSGAQVPITSISREATTDEVYNFLVKTDSDVEHTLVAEGFVVGDLAWQNNLYNQLGSVLLRK